MLNTFLTKVVKMVLSFIICLSALFLTGCWDRVELNDLGLVLATGLDKTDDDQIELSVQLAIPEAMGGEATGSGQGGGGNGKKITVEKATGKTISEAVSSLQERFSRRIFWGHNQVIIIGKSLAESGIQKHIDFFARFPRVRLRSYIFATNSKAIDLLKVTPAVDRSSAEVARELANFRIGMTVTVKDLLEELRGEAKAVGLPWIEVKKEPSTTKGLQLYGTAVFKNGQMVGCIDDQLTRGLLWLRNEMESSTVTVQPEGYNDQISFTLLRSYTKLIPKIENGKWKMVVKIVTEDDAAENETNLQLTNPVIAKKLEKEFEKTIENRIHMTLEEVQKKMGADILGFAEAFHRHYPDEWEKVKDQWDEKFPKIEVEIQNKVYIRRPGVSTSL
ncbi:Ger(x)C family spore germination protein [Bacillus alveayuensis]|uniref:Ger(x)C family spore germination protein n=1 Tax=Aeribacillus alveayuensis TaxID=279215 RepID=UPI0005D10940|nr:Ger(x)C family spore germination protein [Bacillus alveayuensis]